MSFSQLNPIRVAFIGGALNSAVGYTHFNASRLDGHYRLEAGCFSRDNDQNKRSAQIYGISPERTYLEWSALLEGERNQLDAIVVLTPTPSHAEIVTSALEAGYPVISEKSLGISSEECAHIEGVVKRLNGFLAVTYNYSGYPMVRELRRMILNGDLGVIQQIHIEMPQEGYLRKGANPQEWRKHDYGIPTVSLDLGVHVHHLVEFITGGKKPLSAFSNHASYGQFKDLIDNVYCLVQYQDDLRVQAWWGKTALGRRNGLRIRVFGSMASAEWYQMEPEDLHFFDNDGHHLTLDRGSSEAVTAQELRYNRFKAGHPSGFVEAFSNLYADIADSLRAYLNGNLKINDFVGGATISKEGLLFLECLSKSAQLNQSIDISTGAELAQNYIGRIEVPPIHSLQG